MDHVRLSGSEVKALAMQSAAVSKGGFDFNLKDDHVLEAAVGKLMNEKGNVVDKLELVAKSHEADYAEVRTTIAKGVKDTMLSAVPMLGGRGLDIISTTGMSKDQFQEMARDFIKKGKMNQSVLVNSDPDGLKIFLDAITPDSTGKLDMTGVHGADPTKHREERMLYEANRDALIETVKQALGNRRLEEVIKQNSREVLEDISKLT